MIVHWAIVTHRHGSDVFLGRTPEELEQRLAEYANQWAGEIGLLERTIIEKAYAAGDNATAVRLYFEYMQEHEREWRETGQAEIEDPPIPASKERDP